MPRGQFSVTNSRPRLLRRLRNLRNVEWFNVPFLIVILSLTWPDRTLDMIWQRLSAYLVVAGLLLIGGWYWHLKVRQIGEGRPIESELAVLARAKWIAATVLAVVSIALLVSSLRGLGSTADRWWATGFLVLAWLEYVNYFHLQLMHDTRSDLARLKRTRRLRRSWLASDLEAYRKRSEDR